MITPTRPRSAVGACRTCGDSGSLPEWDPDVRTWQSGDTPCPDCCGRWCPVCSGALDPDGYCATEEVQR